MRARCLALVLATLPLLAGCFGAQPEAGLAKPTDVTVYPPTPAKPTRELPQFNTSDPGLVHTMPWNVGDGWDWESNGTTREYRTIRVLDAVSDGGRTLYRIEETYGKSGNPPNARSTQWVDGDRWMMLNSTDLSGSTFHYIPGKPLRFYQNATFAFNETGYDGLTGRIYDRGWFTYSFLEAKWVITRLHWGQLPTAVVVHETFDSNGGRVLLRQYVSPDHANPVRYVVDDVAWTMVAAHEGGRQLGVLHAT